MTSPLFQRVVIIGVGLIGSSLGMNLIRKKLACEVIGVGRQKSNLQKAVHRHAIHRWILPSHMDTLLNSLSVNDLVVLATPVQSIKDYLQKLAKFSLPLVMDAGSTKKSLVVLAEKNHIRFVGAHPIAGTEKTGAIAGDKNLFRGKKCILTPTRLASRKDIQKIERLWRSAGSRTFFMTAQKHDDLLGMTSHLPHAVAYTLVSAIQKRISLKDSQFALGGLKDTTRIAASSPRMWHDIFLENRDVLIGALKDYSKEIKFLQSLLAKKDSRRLLHFLKKSQQIRLKLSS